MREAQTINKVPVRLLSFPATCTPGTVFAISAHTGGRNNTLSQCAARKSVRILGARSPFPFASKKPQGFSML